MLAHIIGAAIEDLVDEREDSAIVDNDTQDITLGTWRHSAYRYFTGPVFNDHCEWLDTTSEAAIAIFRLQPTLDKLGERYGH